MSWTMPDLKVMDPQLAHTIRRAPMLPPEIVITTMSYFLRSDVQCLHFGSWPHARNLISKSFVSTVSPTCTGIESTIPSAEA
jgi:hypothetical protein